MTGRFRHSSTLLLAVFTVGGLFAPLLHEVEHAAEWKEARVDHVAAGDHHHHSAADDHGAEALPPCPEPLSADLACVLCHVVSVEAVAKTEAVVDDRPSVLSEQVAVRSVAGAAHGFHLVRGPPGQAA